MLNVKALARVAKGAATPDELLELLAGLGIEAEMRELSRDDAERVVAAARALGAQRKFISMNGGQLLAMVILPGDPARASLPN